MTNFEILFVKTQHFNDELIKTTIAAHNSEHARHELLKQFEDARIYRIRVA